MRLQSASGYLRSMAWGSPIFVYGTLKAGFQNHAHYCRGVHCVVEARTWGRLYLWEPGIPILAVPRRHVLLIGSTDIAADLAAAQALEARRPDLKVRMGPQLRWRRIRGQLLYFADSERRLHILDALEGFTPTTGARGYQRVLLPVRATEPDEHGEPGVRAAWVYVLPHDEEPPGKPLALTSWEPGSA